jgi:Icc-related predicted phosphoesterase
VYHAPPDESPTSWTGKRYYGDQDLRGWIELHQPKVVITGHVHEAPFATDGSWLDRIGSTWIVNSGRQIGPIPTHVVIDTKTAQASWASQEGVETAALD